MQKKSLTFALVGSGKWAKNYITTFNTLSTCKLKYISSPHIFDKKSLPKSLIRISNYTSLTKYSNIDGVIIATSPDTHKEVASFFMKSDYPVLLEKPITTNYNDALILEKIHDNKKQIFLAGHIYCYNPFFQAFQKSLHSLGKISVIEFSSGKRPTKSMNESPLWEWAPHDISMALTLTKRMPQAVSAEKIDKGRGVRIVLTYNKGLFITITTGWIFTRKTRNITAVGEKRKLQCNFYEKGKDKITQHALPLEYEILAFAHAIRSNKQPITNMHHAIRVSKILDAAERSILSQRKKVSI